MKIVYYVFGAFIGFGCGTVINLIFYWVEKSGTYSAAELVRDYGLLGEYLFKLIYALPYFGIALGIVMVKLIFGKELDGKRE